MPNRDVHLRAGMAAGALVAAWWARNASGPQLTAETFGGLIGGALGGAFLDILDPATSPRHRGIAHSAAAVGALTLGRVAEWQAHCREHAAHFDSLAAAPGADLARRRDAEWNALFWRFAAGLLIGLVAGYVSHVVLDAQTPDGIPIIER